MWGTSFTTVWDVVSQPWFQWLRLHDKTSKNIQKPKRWSVTRDVSNAEWCGAIRIHIRIHVPCQVMSSHKSQVMPKSPGCRRHHFLFLVAVWKCLEVSWSFLYRVATFRMLTDAKNTKLRVFLGLFALLEAFAEYIWIPLTCVSFCQGLSLPPFHILLCNHLVKVCRHIASGLLLSCSFASGKVK